MITRDKLVVRQPVGHAIEGIAEIADLATCCRAKSMRGVLPYHAMPVIAIPIPR